MALTDPRIEAFLNKYISHDFGPDDVLIVEIDSGGEFHINLESNGLSVPTF